MATPTQVPASISTTFGGVPWCGSGPRCTAPPRGVAPAPRPCCPAPQWRVPAADSAPRSPCHRGRHRHRRSSPCAPRPRPPARRSSISPSPNANPLGRVNEGGNRSGSGRKTWMQALDLHADRSLSRRADSLSGCASLSSAPAPASTQLSQLCSPRTPVTRSSPPPATPGSPRMCRSSRSTPPTARWWPVLPQTTSWTSSSSARGPTRGRCRRCGSATRHPRVRAGPLPLPERKLAT